MHTAVARKCKSVILSHDEHIKNNKNEKMWREFYDRAHILIYFNSQRWDYYTTNDAAHEKRNFLIVSILTPLLPYIYYCNLMFLSHSIVFSPRCLKDIHTLFVVVV